MTTPVKSTGVLRSLAEANIFTFHNSIERFTIVAWRCTKHLLIMMPLSCVLAAYDKHLLICNSIEIFFSGLALSIC